MVKRILMIFAVCMTVTVATPTAAWGQDNGYGFDQVCKDLGKSLGDVGLPGLGVPGLGDAASAMCQGANATGRPVEGTEAAKDKMWDSTFGKVVDSLLGGLGQLIIMSLVFWTKLPNERITDSGNLFNKINDYTYQAQILLLIASVIISGARLAEARRGAAMSQAAESFRVYARVVFSSWMLGAVIVAGTQASDRFSSWLIDDATNGNAKSIAELMVKTSQFQAFSPGLVLIIAIVGMLGALAQVVLSVVRQGLLVVAAGFMPLAAAASGMKTGKQSYEKLTGWVIAFMLWKPVAAVVYMIAFTTANVANANAPVAAVPTADQAQRMLVGIVLLCSVAFVLPALMRLVTPAVSIVGSGGSGLNAAAGALVAGAAVTTGGKAIGVKDQAGPGAAGYVPPGGGGGSGPAPGGTAAVRGPKGGPSGPRQVNDGGGASAAVPAGAAGAGRSASARINAVRAGAAAVASADRFMGDLAGDRWVNRSPDLGRSTIPR
jgi:hypothetical protein